MKRLYSTPPSQESEKEACEDQTGNHERNYERAAKLYGAAHTIVETGGHSIDPLDHAEFDRHIQIAVNQLGQESFVALEAEGRALTMEQAIEYALERSASSPAQFLWLIEWYHHPMTTATAEARPNIAFIKYRLAKLD